MDLIVGIDAGKTCGIACVDFNGSLVTSMHLRFAGLEGIIAHIREIGTPVIVAGDKPVPSLLVRKINAAFNARIFTPEREFSMSEKRITADRAPIRDIHERDAYFAAIKAYNAFANKLNHVARIAALSGIENVDEIKAKVIRKHSVSEAMAGIEVRRR